MDDMNSRQLDNISHTLGRFGLSYRSVGSRVTCNPPPMDTDEDVLVLVDWLDIHRALDGLRVEGWERGTEFSVDHQPEFYSLGKGNVNVILTDSQHWFDRFLLATRVATKLNLLNKDDRITLFQAILYGNG